MAKKKKSKYVMPPIKLKEEPSFQEVMKSIKDKRRKESQRKSAKPKEKR